MMCSFSDEAAFVRKSRYAVPCLQFSEAFRRVGRKAATRGSLVRWSLIVVLLVTAGLLPVHAAVQMPTGEFRETVEDLRIKVRGGYVVVARTWQADDLNKGLYRWHVNPAWDDLSFKMDVIDGVPKTIHRSGATFERTGNDVYVFDRQYFIRAVKDDDEITGWRWSDRAGNWITYAADGKITAYGNRNGVIVTFVRDGQQRIEQLLDANNAVVLTYGWTGSRLTSLTDRASRTVTYGYTGDKLTTVTDVLDHEWTYGYSGTLLTTLTDPENRTTTITYNGNRAVRVSLPKKDAQTNPQTKATNYTYEYDRVARIYTVVIRSPENRRTERRYDVYGRLRFEMVGNRTTTQMAKDGDFVEIVTDERGGITRTEFDANRNPVKVTYPDGTSTTSKYDGTYGNLLEHVDERGTKTTYVYNGSGLVAEKTEAVGKPEQRVTQYTYDAHGQQLTETVKGANPSDDATTTYAYDAFGNVASVTDAEQRTTGFTHHVTGAVLVRIDPRSTQEDTINWTTTVNAAGLVTGTSGPLGHATTITYDDVGNRTALTDPLQKTTTFEYDDEDRLVKTIDPLGGETSTTYSDDGLRLLDRDPENITTAYGYDADGRLHTITDAADNETSMDYGAAGTALAGLLVATNYPTYREEYKYDQRGRRTQTIRVLPPTSPGGTEARLTQTTGYDAAGNRTAEIDAANRTTLHRYDALSRLIATTDAEAGVTGYGYDQRDNLTSVTDANHHTHTFTYDRVGQVKTESRPMGATIRYEYDAAGNLTQRTSPGGERRQYDYDKAGRKTDERHYPSGSDTPSQTVAYTYDGRSALTGYTQTGDTHSAAVYVYDDKGQKTEETVTYGEGSAAFSNTMRTGFRANGQKQSFTYPDDTTVNYTYTENGLLASTTVPGGGSIEWQDYAWQQPTKVVMPGAVRTLEYDALQRPTRIRSQAIGAGTINAPQGDVIMDYRYTFDTAGNITTKETEDGPYIYTYDKIDRLLSATPPVALQRSPSSPGTERLPVEGYTYDPVHNRLTSQHQPGQWKYNADNQLVEYGAAPDVHAFTYNASGHVATELTGGPGGGGRSFHYDAGDRLARIEGDGQSVVLYGYDPMGRRISFSGTNGVSWFLYSDEGLVAEIDQSSSVGLYYGWRARGLWATDPLWMSGANFSSQLVFYQNDHLWTPQRVTDRQGDIQWMARSEAFGKVVTVVADSENNLRLPGQVHDGGSGLHYNFFRDYSPEQGRYLQLDPIGLAGGINYFTYAKNSPLVWFDSDGRVALCYLKWVLVGGVGGGATGCFIGGAVGAGVGLAAAGVGALPGAGLGCAAGAAKGVGPGVATGLLIAMQECQGECEDENECNEEFTKCLGTGLADAVGANFGWQRCSLCRDTCIQRNGRWPTISHTGDRCDYWRKR